MKKAHWLVSTLLICMSFSLAGCQYISYLRKNLVQIDPYDYQSTYRDMRLFGCGYNAEQYTTHTNVLKQKQYVIENVKALVVPVDFTDYPASSLPLGEEGTKNQLEQVMFSSNSLDWYSLKEYYELSSFDQCHLSGTVGDWYHINDTSIHYAQTKKVEGSREIATAIHDLYLEKYNEAKANNDAEGMSKYDLTQYDANKDGYVDSLILIYSAPISNPGDLFWAFCWSVNSPNGSYLPESEAVHRFFWASYWFFFDNELDYSGQYPAIPASLPGRIASNEVKPDSHTMVHEFGHVLGLPDYYVTNYNTEDYDGLGYLDMMSANIGDHHAFSKAIYGWINPFYVKGSAKVVMRSTTKTGDVIILPIRGMYKNTLLDQYLMIEFLTPDGVAVYDGQHQYGGRYPYYYQKAGIRVTHIDARLGLFTVDPGAQKATFNNFTTSPYPTSSYSYVTMACSNTADDSCFPNYKLIELLPRQGASMKLFDYATDDMLFQEGDTFGGDDGIWPNYKMHDNRGGYTVDLGFTFTITKIKENQSAEITFTKIS